MKVDAIDFPDATRLTSVNDIEASGGGGGGGFVSFDEAKLTSGDVTVTNNTDPDTLDASIDLTLAASEGDLVVVGVSALWNNGVWTAMDACTMVGGAKTNYVSTGSSTPAGLGELAWFGSPGDLMHVSGKVPYTVVAGDLTSGQITLRLLVRNSGTNRVLRATSGDPVKFWAVNLGQAGSGGSGAYTETIGDGSTTAFTINHGLGSDYPVVSVWDLTGTDPLQVEAEVESIDTNNVRVTFTSAPVTDGMQVTVVGGAASGGMSMLTNGSTTDSVVNPMPTTNAPVDSMDVTVPASGMARTVSVSFSVEMSTTTERRFALELDGTQVWPSASVGLSSRAMVSAGQYFTAGGVTVDIPGDSATHVVRVVAQASTNTDSTTFKHRSITVLDPGA